MVVDGKPPERGVVGRRGGGEGGGRGERGGRGGRERERKKREETSFNRYTEGGMKEERVEGERGLDRMMMAFRKSVALGL